MRMRRKKRKKMCGCPYVAKTCHQDCFCSACLLLERDSDTRTLSSLKPCWIFSFSLQQIDADKTISSHKGEKNNWREGKHQTKDKDSLTRPTAYLSPCNTHCCCLSIYISYCSCIQTVLPGKILLHFWCTVRLQMVNYAGQGYLGHYQYSLKWPSR